jgi:salicylate hydroxylase
VDATRSRQIIIAGAGIAGLTAALSFAARGFSVRLFEQAATLEEVGAGIQLSPNATRILDRLDVLQLLRASAVRPEAVILRDAGTLSELARVPLGEAASQRWKAPYLVVHRADLQSALLARIAREPEIRLVTGAAVRDVALHARGITASIDHDGGIKEAGGLLLVGADGVWSTIRGLAGGAGRSRFSGQTAWRATIAADSEAGRIFYRLAPETAVTAFLHPRFHFIAYPTRGGGAVNLAAFTSGGVMAESWSNRTDASALTQALAGAAPALARLGVDAGPWTAWPIHTAGTEASWITPGGIALIGDAAHAMTPFAAQGAAMAIEDAETLAGFVAEPGRDLAAVLADWEASRRPRVQKVARRGGLNHFAWRAAGPVAVARNLFLRARSPRKLAADLDWLYGWEPPLRDGTSR